MSTPQDAPNRKKKKARAARKLNEWRKKQSAQSVKTPQPATSPTK